MKFHESNMFMLFKYQIQFKHKLYNLSCVFFNTINLKANI